MGGPGTPSRAGRRRRTALIAVCALLLPLLALELGIRGLTAAGWITEAPARDAGVELGLLDRAAEPRSDVMLLGDSLTRRGVDPAVLSTLIGEVRGEPPLVSSMAQLDVDFRSMTILARELERLDRLPRVVLLGISMGNYGGPRANPGARAIEQSRMGQRIVGCGGEEFPVAWLSCQLGQLSAGWRWRGEPARLLERVAARGMPGGARTDSGFLREDGFEETAESSTDALADMMATSYRGRVVDITPIRLRSAAAGLAELVEYLRGEGVEVVLFTVPYPPPLLDAILARSPDLAARDPVALDTLATAAGTPIARTATMGDWWTPAGSSDLKHLSTGGAGAFTRQLWDTDAFRAAVLGALDRADTAPERAEAP